MVFMLFVDDCSHCLCRMGAVKLLKVIHMYHFFRLLSLKVSILFSKCTTPSAILY